jgi:hypothetical protein
VSELVVQWVLPNRRRLAPLSDLAAANDLAFLAVSATFLQKTTLLETKTFPTSSLFVSSQAEHLFLEEITLGSVNMKKVSPKITLPCAELGCRVIEVGTGSFVALVFEALRVYKS